MTMLSWKTAAVRREAVTNFKYTEEQLTAMGAGSKQSLHLAPQPAGAVTVPQRRCIRVYISWKIQCMASFHYRA